MKKSSPLSRAGRTATVTARFSPQELAIALAFLGEQGIIVKSQSDLLHRIFAGAVESIVADEKMAETVERLSDPIQAQAFLSGYFEPDTISIGKRPRVQGVEESLDE